MKTIKEYKKTIVYLFLKQVYLKKDDKNLHLFFYPHKFYCISPNNLIYLISFIA